MGSASGLLAKDHDGASDPYVECYLTPWARTQHAFRTAHRLSTTEPVWEESSALVVTSECAGTSWAGSGELTQMLHIVVYDHNNFLPDEPIGEIKP